MNNTRLYQIYEAFSIADETNQYQLCLGGETQGTLGKNKIALYFNLSQLFWNCNFWKMKQKTKKAPPPPRFLVFILTCIS